MLAICLQQIKNKKMKTIIIPTDLSLNSLDLVKNAVLHFPNEQINIVLAYGFEVRVSDFQPMDFLGSRGFKSEINKNFLHLKKKISLEHKNQIGKLTIEAFTGTNTIAFKNFLIAHNITMALVPEIPQDSFSTKNHFDISPLIQSNMDKIITIMTSTTDKIKSDSALSINSLNQQVIV